MQATRARVLQQHRTTSLVNVQSALGENSSARHESVWPLIDNACLHSSLVYVNLCSPDTQDRLHSSATWTAQ